MFSAGRGGGALADLGFFRGGVTLGTPASIEGVARIFLEDGHKTTSSN